MSIANLFEINFDTLYADEIRTNRIDTTDPRPLLIANQVATELRLGNDTNPIDVYINGRLYNDVYDVQPQTIKFILNPSVFISSDWYVRGVVSTDLGVLPGIKLVKIGNLVTLHIPAFYGTLTNGNNQSVMTIVTAGDIPSRFLPKYDISIPVDARNAGGLISTIKDFADLVVTTDGYVNLISRTFLWNLSVGTDYDLSLSWVNDF